MWKVSRPGNPPIVYTVSDGSGGMVEEGSQDLRLALVPVIRPTDHLGDLEGREGSWGFLRRRSSGLGSR